MEIPFALASTLEKTLELQFELEDTSLQLSVGMKILLLISTSVSMGSTWSGLTDITCDSNISHSWDYFTTMQVSQISIVLFCNFRFNLLINI